MLEQVGTTLRFHAFFTAAKVGKTGLVDVIADVRRNGALVVTGGAAIEEGGGLYYYDLSDTHNTVEGSYTAVFKTADGSVDQQHVPALWVVGKAGVENLDATISSRAAAGATVTVASPVAVDGTTLELVRGDDYLAAQGRQLMFTSDDWPDLSGATIRMTIRRRREAFGSGSDPVIMELTDVYASRVAGVGSQTVVFEITAANSVALLPGTATGKYDIEARLPLVAPSASPSPSPSVGDPVGTVVTLVVGVVNVVEDQTR
jgi:hypothetical protein